MEYTLEYFISKFEAIPEDKWTAGVMSDSEERHCAIGHCGSDTCSYVSLKNNNEARSLLDITGMANDGLPVIVNVNDGYSDFVWGSNPKERVVNYLKSLRK